MIKAVVWPFIFSLSEIDALDKERFNIISFISNSDLLFEMSRWFMGPSQVNGYYSPRQNRIGKFCDCFMCAGFARVDCRPTRCF